MSNNSEPSALRKRRANVTPLGLYLVAGVGLVVRLALAWAPVAWLVKRCLPDDAFYYFTIAGKIVSGTVPSFDGISATNGFHPLWTALLVPIFSMAPDRQMGVHLALTLCALLDALSILLLFRLARRIGASSGAALCASAVYAVTPVLLTSAGAMNGLETAVNILVTFLYLLCYRDVVGPAAGKRFDVVQLGILAGLLFMARTDNVVLLGVTSLHMLVRVEKSDRFRLLLASIPALIIVAPWLLWSWSAFGSIVQSSGQSIAWFARDFFAQSGWGISDYLQWIGANAVRLAHYFPVPVVGSFFDRTGAGILSLVILVLVAWWLQLHKPGTWHRMPRSAVSLGVAIALVYLLFIAMQTIRTVVPRTWYFAPFVPVGYALLAGMLPVQIGRFMTASWWKSVAITAAIGYVIGCALLVGVTGGGRDIEHYRMAEYLNSRHVAGVVGGWNVGILGYYVKHATVVNLDGVVNNSAIPYMQSHELGEYCRISGITWLVDDLGSMRVWSKHWGGESRSILDIVQPLYDIPLPDSRDTLRFGRLTTYP